MNSFETPSVNTLFQNARIVHGYLTMKSANTKEYNVALFNITCGPFLLYGLLAALYVYNSKASWFSWHPFCMVVSFISLAGNAVVIKKIGGYSNTKLHGFFMLAASAIAGFGWYVIYSNKELFKKKHLMTLHGKFGAAVLVAYFLLGIGGAVALNPDNGILKGNQTFRTAHKWAGRALNAAAWTSCVLGFNTLYPDNVARFAFTLPLIILGFFVLL